jgi:hypothetical protein
MAIMTTPPKLRIMAHTSKRDIRSPIVRNAIALAKKGAKFPTVSYTVIGTRIDAKLRDIRPINPITLLINKGLLK